MAEADVPRGWREHRAVDAALVTVLTVVLVLGAIGEAHPASPANRLTPAGAPVPVPPAWAYGLVVVAGGVLLLRRRRPALTLVVSVAAVGAYSLLGYVNGSALVAPLVALYAVTSAVPQRRAIWWSLVTLVALTLVSTVNNPLGHFSGGVVLLPALVATAYFAGVATANRRALLASMEQRGREEAQRQVDAERLRIARELHDVVAHTMATINVQASAAVHVARSEPETAEQAMRAVKAASKEGLRELRAVLDVLRRVDSRDGSRGCPAAGPGPARRLVDGARHGRPAGHADAARSRPAAAHGGRPRRLPDRAGVADERHPARGPGDRPRDRGRRRRRGARRGRPTPASGPAPAGSKATSTARSMATCDGNLDGTVDGVAAGFGLVGMRERAASVGGTVETGARRARRLPGGRHPAAGPGLGVSGPGVGRSRRERSRAVSGPGVSGPGVSGPGAGDHDPRGARRRPGPRAGWLPRPCSTRPTTSRWWVKPREW